MKKIKNLMSLFLSFVVLMSVFNVGTTVSAADTSANITEKTPIKIEVETDIENPSVYSVVEFTVRITNTGEEDITNITAQTIFDDLSPVSKNTNETHKDIETLKAGESFFYSYCATLSMDNSKLNFFYRVILWFVRLFNGGYIVGNTNIDDGRTVIENITEFSFGNIVAKNVVEIYYEDTEITDEEFEEYLEISEDVENQLDKIQASEEYKNFTTVSKINSLYKKLSELESQGLVKNIYYDNSGIEYEYICGISHLIIVDNKHTSSCYSNAIDMVPLNTEYINSNIGANQTDCNFLFVNGLGIINEDERKAFERMVESIEYFSQSGISVQTCFSASIDSYRQLSGYDLIYIVSHGDTTLFKKTPHIKTTEIATKEKIKDTYKKDLKNKSIDTFEFQDTDYFRIYPSFFEKNYPNNELENSIVLLSVCKGFGTEEKRNDDFGISFSNAGASTVIGFYNNADMRYADYLNQNIMHYLMIGESTGDAFEKSVNNLGNNAQDFNNEHLFKSNSSLTYPYIYGRKDVKLDKHETKIHGKFQAVIKDSVTKEPIEGVSIQIVSSIIQFVKTDSNGCFEIKLPTGNYTCQLYKDGYAIKTAEVEIKSDQTITDTIYLTSTTIIGTVIDSITGRPIPNVWVEATDNNDPAVSVSSFTDENGQYSIPLESGSYVIGFSHNDYMVEVRDITVGSDCPNINIELTPLNGGVTPEPDKCSITITVVDEITDKPIENVIVEVTEQGDSFSNVLTTTTTDEGGRFYVELPEGDYVFSLSHDDYQPSIVPVTINAETVDGVMYLSPMDNPGGEDDDENDDNRADVDSGDCGANGDNVKWTLYDDGELVISGSGDMENYNDLCDAPWCSYDESIKKITISDNITSIGDYAFSYCENFSTISLPDGVKKIGKSSFCNCESLASIVIPNSVTYIGDDAFSRCVSLASIVIPNSVTYIGDDAFFCCLSLVSICVDDSNLYYSSDLYGVLYNKNKSVLMQYPMGNIRDTYNIPEGVKTIGDGAFRNCDTFINIYIPNSVITIGAYAFSDCDNLQNIIIPDSVVSIGYSAFGSCEKLKNIKISKGLTFIGGDAFIDCKNLESITLFEGLTKINSQTFSGCTKLTHIEIPDSITCIDSDAFINTGYYNEINNWENDVLYIGNHLIEAKETINGLYEVKNGTKSISVSAFSSCNNLTKVNIPDSVTNIGSYAFYDCLNLVVVNLSNNISNIEVGTFYNCSSITAIEISDKVNNIDYNAFYNCSNLKALTMPVSAHIDKYGPFKGCVNIEKITLTKGTGIMQDFSFGSGNSSDSPTQYTHTPWYISNNSIKEIIIEDGVTYIGEYAFYLCDGIDKMTIPNTVTTFAYRSFNYTNSLKNVYYSGSEEQWKKIEGVFYQGEDGVTIHYNS